LYKINQERLTTLGGGGKCGRDWKDDGGWKRKRKRRLRWREVGGENASSSQMGNKRESRMATGRSI